MEQEEAAEVLHRMREQAHQPVSPDLEALHRLCQAVPPSAVLPYSITQERTLTLIVAALLRLDVSLNDLTTQLSLFQDKLVEAVGDLGITYDEKR